MSVIATNNSMKRLLRLIKRNRDRELYTKLLQIDQGRKQSNVPNTAQANNAAAITPHGWFEHTSGSDPPFSSSGRDFTIDRDSTIYIQGVETAVSGDTVALTSNALNLVFYDTNGDLQTTTTIPSQIDFQNQVWMFFVLTDATNVICVGDERHGIVMDVDTHFHMHYTIGTLYKDGLALSGLDINDTGANPDAAQGAISDGEIHDQDIEIAITDGAGTGRFEQELSPIAELPIFYRSGAPGDWRKLTATTWLVDPADGANRANYNDPNGGGAGIWGLSTVDQNDYLAMWIFAINDYNDPIVMIMGQEAHNTLQQAKDGNQFADLLFGSFPFAESRVLFRIIFQTSTTYGNTAKARAKEILDFRQQTMGGNQNALAGDHLSLAGLNDGIYNDGNHQNLVPVHIEASTDPTVNDDISNYKVGTIWKRTDNSNLWICTDNTDGAAVWKQIWSSADVTGPASSTDNAIARFDGTAGNVIQNSTATIADNGVVSIPGIGDGGMTNYDLRVGNVTTPDYGIIQIGNSAFGRTSYNVGSIDLDGTIICRNIAGPVTSEIEFIWTESAGGTARFALPKSGVGNATYNSRSMLIAGPAPADTDFVKVSYWQTTNNIFDNLACDTAGDGADLGVQNDLEVEGDIFTDSIKESTPGADIALDDDTTINGNVTQEGVTKIKERAAAIADTAAYGQFWVRDDTPCVPMFTDDAGADVQLGLGAGLQKTSSTNVPAGQHTTITVAAISDTSELHFARAQYELDNVDEPIDMSFGQVGIKRGEVFITRVYKDGGSLKVDVYNDYIDADVIVWYTA